LLVNLIISESIKGDHASHRKYTVNGSENLMFTLSALYEARQGKAVFIQHPSNTIESD
jgi:hypothetical protein